LGVGYNRLQSTSVKSSEASCHTPPDPAFWDVGLNCLAKPESS
jgi:hypothetical protein